MTVSKQNVYSSGLLDQSQEERLDFYIWAAQMERDYSMHYQTKQTDSKNQSKIIKKKLTISKSVVK